MNIKAVNSKISRAADIGKVIVADHNRLAFFKAVAVKQNPEIMRIGL